MVHEIKHADPVFHRVVYTHFTYFVERTHNYPIKTSVFFRDLSPKYFHAATRIYDAVL
jgi:hypothetical protein